MPKSRTENRVSKVPIEKLVDHPDNPNRMSKGNFGRLVRNIERTGRYEPLIVRPKGDAFEIINGRHRRQALRKLGYETVDVVVWDIDDEQTDILLATLNRLGGSNVLEKKLALLSRLNERTKARDLAKLLPHSAGQIQRLVQIHSGVMVRTQSMSSVPDKSSRSVFANPKVFFLSDAQQQIVEAALSLAREGRSEKTKAARNAAALAHVAQGFIEGRKKGDSEGR
jgi:ParB family chromosome partitioning protein